jgi:hypothetical protein
MKVKEIPISFYNSIKLRRLPLTTALVDSKGQIPVIVSLTTIEPRLGVVDLVIRSILNQSVLPQKLLLWVHHSLKEKLPAKLTALQSEIFEIRTTPLHSSHKKLIHTIKAFPSTTIITCDDDLMYRPDWLYLLQQEALLFPGTIIANQTRKISRSESGDFLPYSGWPVNQTAEENPSYVLPIGAEGVLYPPESLDHRYAEEELFMKLAPKADDLWFKSMSLLKGTACKLASNRGKNAIPILGSQKSSLKHLNIKKDMNSVQWGQLVHHFDLNPILKNKLKHE